MICAVIYLLILGLYGIIMCVGVVALVRLWRVTRQIRRDGVSDELAEVPTVSVCVPARNERYALAACLDRVLASDYPKLEILVLDDESDDETSLLIKSYAHAGVRFIAGKPLPEGWLGKNYAIDTLLRAASGTYVVFLDVDTHIGVYTISRAVRYLEYSSAPLLSTIPHRDDTYRVSALLGSLRYLWTLLFARRVTPASSAFWVVQRQRLLETAELAEYRQDSFPEMSLQRSIGLGVLYDSYALGVSYEKRWSSQIDTSVRLLRPIIGRGGVVAGIVLVCVGLLPVLLAVAAAQQLLILGVVVALNIVVYLAILTVFYRVQWSSRRYVAILLGPLVVLQEAVVLSLSYYRYARGTVTWKGRAITLQRHSRLR